jgi:tetratricopeptide (TPR) repeat protein
VAQLASQLLEDGVDARLDRWHLQDRTIPEFMNSETRLADKVLVLCSPKYQEKVHAMEDGGPSTGSGWESRLLNTAMFTEEGIRSKVVIALARGQWQESVPSSMQALQRENLTHVDETKLNEAYILLLRKLTGTTESAPPLRSLDIEAPGFVAPLFGGKSLEPLATDREVLPPVVPLPARHYMPYHSLGERFSGRVNALWELHDLLTQADKAIIQGVGVVVGSGGLGKTQLATEYVHRFGNNYPGGVFWADAEQGLETVIQKIAFSSDITVDGALSVEQQCEVLWRSLRKVQAPVLIVFDNFLEDEPLQPWLPTGNDLKFIVTTRRRDLAFPKLKLPYLNSEEGLALLNSRDRSFGSEAIPLVNELGGLPLALELLCNYLNQMPTLSVEAVRAEIAKTGELSALDVFTEHYKDHLPTGHEKAIGATFQLSLNLASEAEYKLLKMISFLAPTPVPRRLLKRAFADTSDSPLTDPVDNGISALERLSLVELDEDYDPQMHRLLISFIHSQAQEYDDELKTLMAESLKEELSRSELLTDTASLNELEKVLPHGQAVLNMKIIDPEKNISIATYMLFHQQDRGRYQDARKMGQFSLSLAQQSFEPGHLSIAIRQSNLATVLQDLDDLKGAKTLLTEALKSNQQNFEPGHPNIAISQSNLALVLLDLNDLEGAKTLLTEALKSNRQNFEPGHPNIAKTQSNLALVLQGLGDLEGAKTLLAEALESDQKSFEPGHTSITNTQSNLALVLLDLGEFEDAKSLLVQSYEAFKNLLGDDHPNTLAANRNLQIVINKIQKQ